jgi:mRNA interferase RelE/StbE
MYKIKLSNTAKKDLDKIDYQMLKRLYSGMKSLEFEPRPVGCIKLKGEIAYRLRIGNYRIIYEIDKNKNEILIYRVAHRKEVYIKK